MAVRFQLRRDTAANWTSVNPILALGEPGVETDTLKVKVGDGVTAWNSLAYSITKDFTDLTSKPTTIAGYGITDAVASSSVSVFGASLIDDADATTARTTLGLGTAATTAATAYATAAQGSTADTAVQPGDIGTAAAQSVSYFATAAQGSTADTAVQPGDNIQTSIIDSSDSSAITITPDVVMQAGLTVGNHIVPSSNENIDLGSVTNRFRELFLSGNTINLGGALIKRVAGNTVELPIGSNIGGKNIAATDQDLNTTDAVTFANITTSGYLRGPASFVIDPAAFGDDTGTVVIAGNLQVDGTQTTINSTTVSIDDLNFSIATDAADSAAANGAGITVGGAGATLNYTHATTSWDMNKPLNVTGNIGVTGTVDGVDIQTLNTTAGAALPKAGGTMTGTLNVTQASTADTIKLTRGTTAHNNMIKFVTGSTDKWIVGQRNDSTDHFRFYSYGTSSDVLSIQTDGNVGIGETVPVAKLHIQGSGTSGQVSSSLILENSSSGTAGLQITGAAGSSHLDFMYAGGPGTGTNTLTTGLAMTLEGVKAGNVGINTTEPGFKLDVVTASADGIRTTSASQTIIRLDTTNTNAAARNWQMAVSSVVHGDFNLTTSATKGGDPANATSRLYIDASGNVGIGTSLPEAKLDVKSTLAITEASAANSNSELTFYSKFSDSQRGYVLLRCESLASGSSDLAFRTRNNFVEAERMRIGSSGKIQIGNNIPMWSGSYGGALVLKGNNATADRYAQLTIVDSTGSIVNQGLIVDNGGNVGIGTDDPKRPLQVGATTAFPISFNGNYPDIHMNTYYESGWRVHTTGYGAKTTFNGATGEFTFSNTSGSTTAGDTFTPNDRFTILANGKIGIQNTAPTSKLEVGVANVKNAIALNGGPNGAATVIEMVDAKSGAYSNVTIDVQLAGAGGYFYQVQVAGTSGSRYQTGGGYTNGTGNFSQSTATGAGWTVSSPTSNLIRFVSNLAGTHPVAWIKIGQGLSADHDEDNVTFTWA